MNVIVLGGGIAGLLAAYAYRRQKPTIIEASGKLGGMFTAGGLKYIHDTRDIRQLLKELDLTFEPYQPRGRLLLDGGDGDELAHPEALAGMTTVARYQVQLKHWTKTRGTDQGFRPDCMNDPMGSHGALKCDHQELLRRLEVKLREAGCDIRLGSQVVGMTFREVTLQEGASTVSIRHEVLLNTLPLGLTAKLAPWAKLPSSEVTKLAIYEVELPRNMYGTRWDYMYTPNLRWVSRIVRPDIHQVMAEVPWYLPQSERSSQIQPRDVVPEVMSILNGIGIEGICLNSWIIPGHLRPLDREPSWPSGWYPLGRFAQWDPRATADKVYARALSLAAGHRA